MAVPRLLSLLQDKNAAVRAQTADALGEIADPAAVPNLIHRIGDGDPGVRRAAISALGEMEEVAAVKPISWSEPVSDG